MGFYLRWFYKRLDLNYTHFDMHPLFLKIDVRIDHKRSLLMSNDAAICLFVCFFLFKLLRPRKVFSLHHVTILFVGHMGWEWEYEIIVLSPCSASVNIVILNPLPFFLYFTAMKLCLQITPTSFICWSLFFSPLLYSNFSSSLSCVLPID